MFRFTIRDVLWLTVVVALAVGWWGGPLVSNAYAGLSGPPPSFAIATRDGRHLFVMLSTVPLAKDGGNDCLLPDGRNVSLRETFPSSGLYEIDSTVPIWTVNWYGENGLTKLSPDGRFVVRVNEWGGGYYGEDVTPRWGIRFYDQGVQIKNYNVVDLVDYPSLMEFTSSDWHFLWIAHSAYSSEIDNGFYALETSTRERYRFDVETGEIVEEHRVWRHVARGGVASLAVIMLSCAGLIFWHFRVQRAKWDKPTLPQKACDEPARANSTFSYRLRTLFLLTTGAAIAFAFPHIAVLLSGLTLAVFSTRGLLGHRRRVPSSTTRGSATLWQSLWSSLTLLSWILVYALCYAPVRGLAFHFGCRHDVVSVLDIVVFAPIRWSVLNAPDVLQPLIGLYFDAWMAW